MKKLFLCLFFAAFSMAGNSQRLYFVYLQAEPAQPFFVKMNDKLLSSSPSGYLILSKLRDSAYQFSVGFPQNKWPEQKFTVTVNGKDHGFLLKNFPEKGWGLFDLHTLAIQMAADTKPPAVKTEKADVSAFTDVLAKAADNPALLNKQVVTKTDSAKVERKTTVSDPPVALIDQGKQETKAENITQEVEKDTMVITGTETKKEMLPETGIKKTTEADPPLAKEDGKKTGETEYKRSVVTRRSESSTTEGFGLTFIDEFSNGSMDTIRIIIPNPKPVAAAVKEEPKPERKFLEITTDTVRTNPEPAKTVIEEKPAGNKDIPPVQEKPVSGNTCTAVAGESDFLSLRKLMAAGDTEDDMLDEARKTFKTKCFSAAQLKNLSVLFLTDEGKYRFFDISYRYVADIGNFAALESELKEEYYKNRFRAMLRN